MNKDVIFSNITTSSVISVDFATEFEKDSEERIRRILERVDDNIFNEEIDEKEETNQSRNSNLQSSNKNSNEIFNSLSDFDFNSRLSNQHRKTESEIREFCNSWKNSFPHFRIVGKNPESLKVQPKKKLEISENDLPNLATYGGVIEEVIVEDNCSSCEEILAFDNSTYSKNDHLTTYQIEKKNEEKKKKIQKMKKLGIPPIDPIDSIENHLNALIFDNVYSLFVEEFRPLLIFYYEDIILRNNNFNNQSNSHGNISINQDSIIFDSIPPKNILTGGSSTVGDEEEEDLVYNGSENSSSNSTGTNVIEEESKKEEKERKNKEDDESTDEIKQNIEYGLDNSIRVMKINKEKNTKINSTKVYVEEKEEDIEEGKEETEKKNFKNKKEHEESNLYIKLLRKKKQIRETNKRIFFPKKRIIKGGDRIIKKKNNLGNHNGNKSMNFHFNKEISENVALGLPIIKDKKENEGIDKKLKKNESKTRFPNLKQRNLIRQQGNYSNHSFRAHTSYIKRKENY